MSLSMLVGGADCGPSNPLQSLAKRFDQDRGVQQDFVGGARTGSSSRETFRTQEPPPIAPELREDAARFFARGGPAPQASASTFDLANLRDALPMAYDMPVQAPHNLQQVPRAASSTGWATDFLMNREAVHKPRTENLASTESTSAFNAVTKDSVPWSAAHAVHAGYGYRTGPVPVSVSGMSPSMMMTHPVQRPSIHTDQMSWDREFQSQESMLKDASAQVLAEASSQEHHQKEIKPVTASRPADDLSRLAAQLVDAVKHDQNPKFQKSEFMGLMRQLRDGEVVVEDDKFVSGISATRSSIDVKGKGRAVDAVPLGGHLAQNTMARGQVLVPSPQNSEALNAAHSQQTQIPSDPHEAYFHQENADFTQYWDAHYKGPVAHSAVGGVGETSSWYEMQRDWDAFEATTTGVRPVVVSPQLYQFQENNPYLVGEASSDMTRHHALHGGQAQHVYESILELEAAVQRSPTNARLWYTLGVKQQEQEREARAIEALRRAVELDPDHLPSWLALSVSYTNESNRLGTYNAVREWVTRHPEPKYKDIVNGVTLGAWEAAEKGDFKRLVDVLIGMARCRNFEGAGGDAGGVDADVQVALAVLLNTTEDYAKAVDCFLTALAVRPEDWQLYNRVGATMANNGQAEEALQYYYRALELNPAYIRARFNIGISCINLRRYEEAASHILDALVLQDSEGVPNPPDATPDNDDGRSRGVTSSALWESLKTTCMHLQRADLAAFCDRGDVDGLREAFYGRA